MSNVIIDIERELSGVSGSHKNVPITQRTETELLKWKGQKETDQAMYSTLQKYWKDAGLQDSDWKPSETPWSAVFISTLLKGHGFPYSVAHRLYTRAIIDSPSSWGAYSIPKTKKLRLHVGDVLIKPRTGSYQATHGDVVYKIQDGMAYLAGGNVGDTARSVGTLPIDQDGYVEGKVSNYVVILKKKGASNLPLILGFAGLIGFFMVKK
jgi:hypothetical protein|tara:strand:- start:292 stop:918 length:627 start_codon:yes stop_codon:yes gene_type:complete